MLIFIEVIVKLSFSPSSYSLLFSLKKNVVSKKGRFFRFLMDGLLFKLLVIMHLSPSKTVTNKVGGETKNEIRQKKKNEGADKEA